MKIPVKVDLTGKTAIVTGGSGTLCSAMAYGLAVSGAIALHLIPLSPKWTASHCVRLSIALLALP